MAVTVEGSLSRAAIPRLPAECRPLVLPGDVSAGVLHVGLGAFHRAHQAVFTEAAIAATGGDWGIVAVAPHSRGVLDAVAAQDLLFSVTTLHPREGGTRAVGAFASLLHASSQPAEVVAALADPAIRVVTLTVTEKAYRMDPASGRIRPDDAELRADLRGDRAPATIPGLLVQGLLARARGAAAGAPLSVVSCDNLPSNGARLRSLVEQCLALVPGSEGVLDNVTFPSTMVDRIVPATSAALLAQAASALGVADKAAVGAEPFTQWVIEDAFAGDRPAWESAGAVLTTDVASWEKLKLRELNGVHSTLAYLGAVAGAETIADTLALAGADAVARRLLAEDIVPTIAPPEGVDPAAYGQSVLDRFANPSVCHRTIQIAMDGSQKLPQRLLHTVLDRRRAGASPRWAALALAAWIRFLAGHADDGRELVLDDPLADVLRPAAARGSARAGVDAVFAIEAVFPAELAADEEFKAEVSGWLADLERHGVANVLASQADG